MFYRNRFNLTQKRHSLTCLVMLAVVSATLSGGLPGQTQSSNYAAASNDPRSLYHGSACTILKTPVDLPDLPRYTSRAYFLGGYDYPADAKVHVHRIALRYAVHEQMDRVLGWYHDTLSSYSWDVSAYNATSNGLMATKGKNSCSITVTKSSSPWFGSVVGIEYKLGQ